LAAACCAGLPLPCQMPDHFPDLLADSLAPFAPDLAERFLRLPADELEVLYDFLLDRSVPQAAGLALIA
jgi:hypothetical protein